MRLLYSIIWHDGIVVGSLFFHRVYAKPDGDWLFHCYVPRIVVSSLVISGLYCSTSKFGHACSKHIFQKSGKLQTICIWKCVPLSVLQAPSELAFFILFLFIFLVEKLVSACPAQGFGFSSASNHWLKLSKLYSSLIIRFERSVFTLEKYTARKLLGRTRTRHLKFLQLSLNLLPSSCYLSFSSQLFLQFVSQKCETMSMYHIQLHMQQGFSHICDLSPYMCTHQLSSFPTLFPTATPPHNRHLRITASDVSEAYFRTQLLWEAQTSP